MPGASDSRWPATFSTRTSCATIPTATCDGRVNPPSTRRQDWLNWRQASIVAQGPGRVDGPEPERRVRVAGVGEGPGRRAGRRQLAGVVEVGSLGVRLRPAAVGGLRQDPARHPTAGRDAARLRRTPAGLVGAGLTAVDDRLQHGQDALRGTLDRLDVRTYQPIVAARPRARQGPVMSRVWSGCGASAPGPRRRDNPGDRRSRGRSGLWTATRR